MLISIIFIFLIDTSKRYNQVNNRVIIAPALLLFVAPFVAPFIAPLVAPFVAPLVAPLVAPFPKRI